MVSEDKIDKFKEAARIIKSAKYLVVFTGAGISAESGVPTFRGDKGIWKKYDSNVLSLSYFIEHPEESWKAQKEFFDIILNANPNYAHIALAELEKKGILKSIVTQNIDNLHQKAGSENVFEFHGTMKTVTCINPRCMHKYKTEELDLTKLPPKCEKCGSVLKTDICFFEENPPEPAKSLSFQEASKTDVMIIVGTSGVVHPAALLPVTAKENGAKIIEINPDSSLLTIYGTTDIFLQGEAGEVMKKIMEEME
ncbi:MAG TPA: NAD-dependent deacylase [Candidatus Pacearchaeota archaeon]|nr:NAD-dependent deacylase [Candidatus Pacearchaeota archaeon]HOR52631.1 NAD-dependent deacylase [Candidatus Pacearchaeota archaeon]HOU79375.1 NAD-dependent deacylase [Candidatus Pacearchaeota archaeon]HQF83064.1 NAD-dependent deacylase [Candidatus Pacearchaeota archaeon]HQJ58073.1 NAD-dependent deacylase [Candidatus Pacearchaeota archaeon]